MKPRHAAALALVGWYLMTPPISKSGDVFYNAPLTSWEHQNVGSTLADCEKNKQAAIRLMAKFSPGERLKAVQAANCIATDDPRLAK